MLLVNAVIVAAGKGKRMDTKTKKQYLNIAGIPILVRTLNIFNSLDIINNIYLIIPKEDYDYCNKNIIEKNNFNKVKAIKGGKERQDSVYNALKACDKKTDYVIVHDGVRPFVSQEIIIKTLDKAKIHKACITGVPVKDTIKIVDENSFVNQTPNRKNLWAVQTPQTFEYTLLLRSYEKAYEEGFYGTDDSTLVERLGHNPIIVEGSYNNIKITTLEDIKIGEAFINNNES